MDTLRPLLAFALALLTVPSSSSAGSFIDGNKLLSECEKPSAFCNPYIMGIAEVMSKETDVVKDSLMICLPDTTTTRQMRDVVLATLKDDPAGRTAPAHWIVMGALLKAWPCKGQ